MSAPSWLRWLLAQLEQERQRAERDKDNVGYVMDTKNEVIEMLRARVEELERALQPFTMLVTPASYRDHTPVWSYDDITITHGDLRRARAALGSAGPQKEEQ